MTTAERTSRIAPRLEDQRIWGVSIPIAWVQFAAILLALAAVPFAKRVDPDFWWHLAAGDRIREHGIPRTDPYSWTAAGKPWTTHEWLSEAIMSFVQSAFGYAGNVVLFDLVAIVAFVALYSLARRQGAGSHVLLVLTLLAAATFVSFLTPRPQVFSWLLFAAFLAILVVHERRDSAALIALPLLMLFWANLHLGFVYGLMVVGLWAVVRVVDRIHGRDVTVWVPSALCVACALPALATPSGYDIVSYPLRYLEDRESLSLIAEWRSPLTFSVVLIPYYATFILMAGVLVSPRRPSLFLILVSVAIGALTLTAARNVPFLALVLLPVAGPALTVGSAAASPPVRMRLMMAAPAIVIMAFFVAVIAHRVGERSTFDSPPNDGYPEEGAAWMASHRLDARLYNEYTWGGYLIYRLPDVPVFIDGRTDFYRSTILEDYINIGRLDGGWRELLVTYQIDTLIIRKNSRLASRLRDDPIWEEAFVGPVESVFVKTR